MREPAVPRFTSREFRRTLKQRLESQQPSIIGNWAKARAILIPLNIDYCHNADTHKKATATARRVLANALRQLEEQL